jgi:hypothetical protein
MEENTKKNLYKAGSKLAHGTAIVADALGGILNLAGSLAGKGLRSVSIKLDEKTKVAKEDTSVQPED